MDFQNVDSTRVRWFCGFRSWGGKKSRRGFFEGPNRPYWCVCVYLAGENLLCPEMEVEKAPLIRPDGGYACTYGKSWGEETLYGWVCRGHTSSAIFDPSLRPFI